jgi:hypothetical protein
MFFRANMAAPAAAKDTPAITQSGAAPETTKEAILGVRA